MSSFFSNSPIDDIALEEDWERSLRHRLTKRYQLGAHLSRTMKMRQILANIERNLKKEGAYPLNKARKFIENYETYPEVRPFAEKVLPKIIEGGTVNIKRLNTYNMLKKKNERISALIFRIKSIQ